MFKNFPTPFYPCNCYKGNCYRLENMKGNNSETSVLSKMNPFSVTINNCLSCSRWIKVQSTECPSRLRCSSWSWTYLCTNKFYIKKLIFLLLLLHLSTTLCHYVSVSSSLSLSSLSTSPSPFKSSSIRQSIYVSISNLINSRASQGKSVSTAALAWIERLTSCFNSIELFAIPPTPSALHVQIVSLPLYYLHQGPALQKSYQSYWSQSKCYCL